MAIFTRWALTDRAKALITKTQAEKATTHFTKAKFGDGIWLDNEEIGNAENIKNEKLYTGFSRIDIPDGNPSTVVLEVVLDNRNLSELCYITEMGIFAQDPDEGEILYCIAVTPTRATYLPANNGLGISTIVERINIEVADSAMVTINTTGAVVAASDFLALKEISQMINEALTGGADGQHLVKKGNENYKMGWETFIPVLTRKEEEFPKVGKENTLYVDPDTSEIYVWKKEEVNENGGYYFKLPLGAQASQTLQAQITANKNNISDLSKTVKKTETALFNETLIKVQAEGWEESIESGVNVYTNEIEVNWMTEDSKAIPWPHLISEDAVDIVKEQKAQAVFFGKGKAFSDEGKLILKCYGKCPESDFGIMLQGV